MLQKRTFNIVVSGISLEGGMKQQGTFDRTIVYQGEEVVVDLKE
jgi:hypothetical protein